MSAIKISFLNAAPVALPNYCGLYWRTHQYMVCLKTNSKAIKIIKIIADPHNPIKNACAVVIQHIDILRFLRLLERIQNIKFSL